MRESSDEVLNTDAESEQTLMREVLVRKWEVGMQASSDASCHVQADSESMT